MHLNELSSLQVSVTTLTDRYSTVINTSVSFALQCTSHPELDNSLFLVSYLL